jgi:hypothetical protein
MTTSTESGLSDEPAVRPDASSSKADTGDQTFHSRLQSARRLEWEQSIFDAFNECLRKLTAAGCSLCGLCSWIVVCGLVVFEGRVFSPLDSLRRRNCRLHIATAKPDRLQKDAAEYE